jgi:hypothetical protein
LRVDDTIEAAILNLVEPGAIAAAIEAGTQAAARRDQVRDAMLRDLEAARYAADRAFRHYDATDPENRLVAAELEAPWNKALRRVDDVAVRIAAHDSAIPARRSGVTSASFTTLAHDLRAVWEAPTTDARLKKRIVRTRHPGGDRRHRRGGRRDRPPDPLDGGSGHRLPITVVFRSW